MGEEWAGDLSKAHRSLQLISTCHFHSYSQQGTGIQILPLPSPLPSPHLPSYMRVREIRKAASSRSDTFTPYHLLTPLSPAAPPHRVFQSAFQTGPTNRNSSIPPSSECQPLPGRSCTFSHPHPSSFLIHPCMPSCKPSRGLENGDAGWCVRCWSWFQQGQGSG